MDRSAFLSLYYDLLGVLVTRQLLLGQSAIVDGLLSDAVALRWRELAARFDARLVIVECVCSDTELHRRRVEGRKRGIPGWHEIDWDHVQRMRVEFPLLGVEHLTIDAVEALERNAQACSITSITSAPDLLGATANRPGENRIAEVARLDRHGRAATAPSCVAPWSWSPSPTGGSTPAPRPEPRRSIARCRPRRSSSAAGAGPEPRPELLPEELRLYDLRYTAAWLMIRQGASVKAVQRQLGHATASITLDTYGHLFPDELEALAGRLEDARTDALASLARTQRGPTVVALREGAGQ